MIQYRLQQHIATVVQPWKGLKEALAYATGKAVERSHLMDHQEIDTILRQLEAMLAKENPRHLDLDAHRARPG